MCKHCTVESKCYSGLGSNQDNVSGQVTFRFCEIFSSFVEELGQCFGTTYTIEMEECKLGVDRNRVGHIWIDRAHNYYCILFGVGGLWWLGSEVDNQYWCIKTYSKGFIISF